MTERTHRAVMRDPFVWGALSLLAVVIVCIIWIFVTVSAQLPKEAHDPFVLVYFAARLMQLTLGMLIGLVLTVLGVIMAWFGVTQDVDVSVESSTAKARLVSAGPGALLVVCGTTIILFCVSLKLEVSTRSTAPDVQPVYTPTEGVRQ